MVSHLKKRPAARPEPPPPDVPERRYPVLACYRPCGCLSAAVTLSPGVAEGAFLQKAAERGMKAILIRPGDGVRVNRTCAGPGCQRQNLTWDFGPPRRERGRPCG